MATCFGLTLEHVVATVTFIHIFVFLFNKTNRCTNFPNLFWLKNKFGKLVHLLVLL